MFPAGALHLFEVSPGKLKPGRLQAWWVCAGLVRPKMPGDFFQFGKMKFFSFLVVCLVTQATLIGLVEVVLILKRPYYKIFCFH